MEKEDLKEITSKINVEIIKLEKSIINLLELTKPISPDCAIGRVSRMDAINNKAINDNALRKAKANLSALNIALQNINDTNFGICVRCKNKIPLGRILLMPQSSYCVHCSGK